MKNTEQKLKKLFDFQKFNRNPKLARLVEETESAGVELTDEELSLVNAAGETVKSNSDENAAGIGGGRKM